MISAEPASTEKRTFLIFLAGTQIPLSVGTLVMCAISSARRMIPVVSNCVPSLLPGEVCVSLLEEGLDAFDVVARPARDVLKVRLILERRVHVNDYGLV